MAGIFGIRITFRGNLVTGIGLGACDELKCFSNTDIKQAELQRSMLTDCLPPSRWFSKEAYSKAIRHMKAGDHEGANAILDKDVIGKATHVCVWVFQNVIIEVVKRCPTLLSNSLPTTYY